jgi:hypothetical protein
MSTKKTIAGGLLLLCVSMCFAVTWEKESAEFQFPTIGVRLTKALVMKDFRFTSAYNRSKNAIVFSYTLPQNARTAVLHIYTIKGSLVQSFSLKNSESTVAWNVANESVAMGTYALSLRCGAIVKNLKISFVR